MRRFNHKLEQQQAPAFFVRGPSAFARLAFFSTLSLVLMATDARLQYLASVRQSLQTLIHPLQLLANKPSQIYRDVDEYFTLHNNLIDENQRLKQHALQQDIALQKLNTLAFENDNLRQLLQANKAIVESSIVAEIMHVGRDLFTKKVIVNRGETHKVVAGEAVVDATGVIGQVTRVYPLSSEVTLITDKSLAIPVQIERNGLRAIAFGHGRDNTLDLPYLPINVDIQRGDRLVTSGIDGVYPAGLSVATVSQIEITPDSPFARIVCVPTGGIENHRQVLLVSIPQVEAMPESAIESPAKLDVRPINAQAKPPKIPKPIPPPKPNNTSKPHASE
ncbi:MAG: rod shape-determining protein MreC [Methylotenera sp.]|nr:rod shape-determining protein MreC [Methylotenera sp.]